MEWNFVKKLSLKEFIKCLFGSHEWEYSWHQAYVGSGYNIGYYCNRRCKRCNHYEYHWKLASFPPWRHTYFLTKEQTDKVIKSKYYETYFSENL